MPVERRSFAVTEAYRARVVAIRDAIDRGIGTRTWPKNIDDLDDGWADRQTAAISQAQKAAIRASSGYLTAFLSTEYGERLAGPELDPRPYVGQFVDGRDLREALRSPIIGTLAARKEGLDDAAALQVGLMRAKRMAEAAVMFAARGSLRDGMEADERVEGWERAVAGTCGACMGASADRHGPSVAMSVHPNCKCVSEPIVRSSLARYQRDDGNKRFAEMDEAAQDAALGASAAYAVRNGLIELQDLVGRESIPGPYPAPDLLVQRPLDELLAADIRAEVEKKAT